MAQLNGFGFNLAIWCAPAPPPQDTEDTRNKRGLEGLEGLGGLERGLEGGFVEPDLINGLLQG